MAKSSQADALAWEREFLWAVRADKSAARAWANIEKAGLGGAAKVWLFQYARIAQEGIAEVRRAARLAVHNFKAARRADSVARERAKDPREKMFSKRRADALQVAANAPWPFRNPHAPSLGDAAEDYAAVGLLPLDAAPSAFADAGDALRRYGPKIMLAVLEAGAASYGVALSPRALVALAACAAPGAAELDERSVRRFLRDKTILNARPQYAERFKALQAALVPSPTKR